MNNIVRILLVSLVALSITGMAACSPEQRSAAGTLAAPAGATLQSQVLTQAASGMQTSAVQMPTVIIQAGKTGIAQAATQAPAYLTPQRPGTGYIIHREDIIVFVVDKPIQVHEAAYRFSTPSYYLIQMNQERYPSISTDTSVLQPGWVIIIFMGTSRRFDLIPYTADAWDAINGCGGAPSGDGITCGEIGLDYVSEAGRLRPECMPNTLSGEYSVLSTVTGSVLYLYGQPFVYGVYWDARSNTVLMGPAIVSNRADELQCG